MRIWLILLNISFVTLLNAQSFELGLLLGGSLYSGDLSPKEFGVYLNETNPAGGAFGRFNLNNALSLRLGLSLAKITGTGDTSETVIRPEFRSNIMELALTAEVNLFTLGSDNFMVKPYLYAGGAFYRFNPQTSFDGGWVDLQPLGTEGQGLPNYEAPYQLTQFSLPFGGGLKFIINDTWAIGAEFGWRKTFTDYLDDISFVEVNYLDVYNGNGSLAAMFSNSLISGPENGDVTYQRGGDYTDWYMMGGITVSYFLGGSGYSSGGKNNIGGRRRSKDIGCPTF
ncbi:MAG: DUF6089 family protein [Saprospiraceae bacterium]|nr:DUF6089 family protein [Saprospiraceae bacterium]